MKKYFLVNVFLLFLIFLTGDLQAQSMHRTLDQVELMKKWSGTWKCESSKDSISIWELKPFSKGYELDYKFLTKGQIYYEIKDFWVFDTKLEKWICFSLQQNGTYDIFYGTFTSSNNFIWDRFDLSNPEKLLDKWGNDFTGSDTFTLYRIIKGSKSDVQTFFRVK
jgi:hypothetical protein